VGKAHRREIATRDEKGGNGGAAVEGEINIKQYVGASRMAEKNGQSREGASAMDEGREFPGYPQTLLQGRFDCLDGSAALLVHLLHLCQGSSVRTF
jgi:hypothetical protein